MGSLVVQPLGPRGVAVVARVVAVHARPAGHRVVAVARVVGMQDRPPACVVLNLRGWVRVIAANPLDSTDYRVPRIRVHADTLGMCQRGNGDKLSPYAVRTPTFSARATASDFSGPLADRASSDTSDRPEGVNRTVSGEAACARTIQCSVPAWSLR
jgi:hypothetical protein